jgi:hypothetical protein
MRPGGHRFHSDQGRIAATLTGFAQAHETESGMNGAEAVKWENYSVPAAGKPSVLILSATLLTW